jgi:chromatin segregation and condensation protein Rec8/ScpA/Scc1 (kleisin family)
VRTKSAPYHNIYFNDLARANKSVVIKTFIELMNLLNKGLLSLEQDAQFGDIKIIGESIVDYTSLIAK